jgi:PST family polysaccharide transporter
MGLYLAAWALSGIYVNTILHAMGTDFYPRLTGVAKDNAQCNQMVNEQAEVSFLVAVPGVIGTIGFAPLVLSVLYSPEFVEAAEILRWLILGILARVIIFPMGYIALAMGKKWCFMGMEAYNHALHVILILMGVWLFGLVGLGVALCVLNIANCWVIRFVAGRLSGFRWSRANLRHWAVLIPPVVIVFLSSMLFDDLTTMLIGAAVAAATGLYCLHTLHRLVGSPAVGRSVRNLLRRLPFAGRATTTTTIKAVK